MHSLYHSLFYVLASVHIGSSLPSPGSLLDSSELLEIQIGWLVYHIMCGYVACVLDCRGVLCLGTEHTEPQKKPVYGYI
jgi:hypothetical protein